MKGRKRSAFSLRHWALGGAGAAALVALAFACIQCQGPRRPSTPNTVPRRWTAEALYGFDGERGIFAGLPRGPHTVTILYNRAYVAGYDENRKCPLWVVYKVSGPPIHTTSPRPDRFRVDRRTRSQVSHDAYTHTGYDRGHMVPNYAIYSRFGPEAQLETFLMSNICPQTPDLNRRRWRELEEKIAGPARSGQSWAERYLTIWVVTGPIFDEHRSLLPSGVEIPDAFYKILLDIDESQDTLRALAFIVPNAPKVDQALETFLVSIAEVENQTGLDFFHLLDDDLEKALEGVRAPALWN